MAEFAEKQLTSKEIFSGKIIRVTQDTIQLESGNTAQREVVHHGGGAGVVALNDKGEVALVRQYRYAVGQELIEIPAGKIEAGEPPLTTARRELEEEAGLQAARLEPFGSIIPTCGYCTEVIYLFLATGLTQVPQHLDPDEFLTPFWMPLDEAVERVQTGEITDSKTVVGLLRAKMVWDEGRA